MFLFQPWWAENSHEDKVTLKCFKWHQMLHCKLLRGVFHPVEEKLYVGVRASWGVIAVLNQAILCRCHLNTFMSYPRAASQVWMHRELLAVISHFPQKQRYFQLTPPTAHTLLAARKEAPAEMSTEVGF